MFLTEECLETGLLHVQIPVFWCNLPPEKVSSFVLYIFCRCCIELMPERHKLRIECIVLVSLMKNPDQCSLWGEDKIQRI